MCNKTYYNSEYNEKKNKNHVWYYNVKEVVLCYPNQGPTSGLFN